ncbi:MAG: HigA family addiction module antitoxin [Bauldia sp.]
MAKKLDPIPPGEILLEEFLKPLAVSQNRLARDIDIPVSRVAEIVKGRRAITADTALRLGEYFGTSAEFWLNLQAGYDLRRIRAAGWGEIRRRIRAREAA